MLSSFLGITTALLQVLFYSLGYQNTDGANVSMGAYSGKKVLIINIATGSARAGQLAELQQLQQQYAGSLVVLAFPSNSFGHEGRSGNDVKAYCQQTYGVTFPIATVASVKGGDIQPVFAWLTSKSANGMMDTQVLGDFQKFLINEEGKLVGEFAPSVAPLSEELTRAITQN